MRQNIFLSAAILLFATACGDNKNNAPAGPPPAVKVVVEPVIVADAVYHDEYPATVTPLNQVELRPQVTGYITAIHFKDGDRVRKGQLLYSIDAQLYNANYQQAVANLNVQEANLSKAQKDADRYRELAKQDAVAKQLVDNAEAALEVAKKTNRSSKGKYIWCSNQCALYKSICSF